MRDEQLAPRSQTAQLRQVGIDLGLVDEYQAAWIDPVLMTLPAQALTCDGRAVLISGPHRFLLSPCARTKVHTARRSVFMPYSASSATKRTQREGRDRSAAAARASLRARPTEPASCGRSSCPVSSSPSLASASAILTRRTERCRSPRQSPRSSRQTCSAPAASHADLVNRAPSSVHATLAIRAGKSDDDPFENPDPVKQQRALDANSLGYPTRRK